MHVRYAPSAAGAATAELDLTDDAPDGPQHLPLSGTGVAPQSGPQGPAGATGATGPAGPAGADGANARDGTDGRLVVVAAGATVQRGRVTVRYA